MSNIRYYSDGERANAAVLNRPLGDLEKQTQYMSEVQFKAIKESNQAVYNSSGVIYGGMTHQAGDVDSSF